MSSDKNDQPQDLPAGWMECEGIWNQSGLGDQPMKPLRLSIESGRIEGVGYDSVGTFTLKGSFVGEESVFIIKSYAGKHDVEYYGKYKKRVLYGKWELDGDSGFWEIQLGQTNQRKLSILRSDIPNFLEHSDLQVAI